MRSPIPAVLFCFRGLLSWVVVVGYRATSVSLRFNELGWSREGRGHVSLPFGVVRGVDLGAVFHSLLAAVGALGGRCAGVRMENRP